MPAATFARYGLPIEGRISPMVLVWPVRKLLALMLGMYFNSLTRFITRALVASLMSVCPRSTFEIVIFDRLRSLAMSLSRTRIGQTPRGGPRYPSILDEGPRGSTSACTFHALPIAQRFFEVTVSRSVSCPSSSSFPSYRPRGSQNMTQCTTED